MSSLYLSDKPIKMIMENDIVSDFVYASDEVRYKLDFIYKRIDNLKDPRDFFIVVLESENNKIIKGIFISKQLEHFSEKLEQNENLTFDGLYKKPMLLNYKASISDALDIFEKNVDCNIILIENENKRYMGKIKRTNIKKRIKEFIRTFEF